MPKVLGLKAKKPRSCATLNVPVSDFSDGLPAENASCQEKRKLMEYLQNPTIVKIFTAVSILLAIGATYNFVKESAIKREIKKQGFKVIVSSFDAPTYTGRMAQRVRYVLGLTANNSADHLNSDVEDTDYDAPPPQKTKFPAQTGDDALGRFLKNHERNLTNHEIFAKATEDMSNFKK